MSAFHVLNTDASMRSGEVAIGVVLRQKRPKGGPLTVIGYISKKIRVDSITEAEYKALIKGLELARYHKPTDLYVYSDSASVVNQVNEERPRFKNNREKLEPLHRRVHDLRKELGEQLKTISISYLPREMNTEADQRAADAFILKLKGQ
jgi:ribonuclease HI